VKVLSDNSRRPGSRLPTGLGVAITLGLACLSWLAPNVVVRLDNTALDFQFRLRGERIAGQEVVLVIIDEKSLKEIGRWPWPRDKQSMVVDEIAAGGPVVIGLDIIYAEPEQSSVAVHLMDEPAAKVSGKKFDSRTLPPLNARVQALDTDHRLARSVRQAGRVVLAMPFFVSETSSEQTTENHHSTPEILRRSEFMLLKQLKSEERSRPYKASGMLPPLDILAQQAKGLGHVYRLPDHDGVTRREVLALHYGDAYYPSFALEVARLYFGHTKEKMALLLGDGVRLGTTSIPTDQKLRMPIDYAGRELRFPWVSATDVLHHRVPREFFRDKAVLVGTAALGTYDQLSTPFSANFSGVEKNATVVENILHQRFLTVGLWSGPIELGLVLCFGLVLTFILPRVRALYGAGVSTTALIGYIGTAQTLFVVERWCLPLVMPVLTIGSIFVVTTLLNFIHKERQAREIHSMFSSYVSPQIVQELMKCPSKATIGGQRKELTMLFADLVGFTTFSEGRPAERVVEQLNEYLSSMTDVIFRWNGTLDKFVGDEIVVFWGAPLEQPDHAELALQCALEMRARLSELQIRWKAQGKPILENGIGINTGVVLVGNIGAEGKKMDYTMIGDHVNLAARFQELTRTLGRSILLTEFTASKFESRIHLGKPPTHFQDIRLRKLRVVTVKGRQGAVAAYAVEQSESIEQTSIQVRAS